MYRRALLASLFSAFAGCSLAPSGPSTGQYPTSGPNIFVSFDWNPDRRELTVTFDRGNRVTAANTSRLAVVTPDAESTETVWVADDTAAESVAEFPLTPGATVTHEIPEPAMTRLVWVAPDRVRSMAIDVWRPETDTSGADG
ncbi:hypothetical protein [Halomicrobium urmianum]|uniref:hypothetical protein n=1 Tax=Halomicrobium urmianum TaxID=1586233 RepID=UPI001CD9993E|nr:hypothetical protein [Halomicrobium urmianum]